MDRDKEHMRIKYTTIMVKDFQEWVGMKQWILCLRSNSSYNIVIQLLEFQLNTAFDLVDIENNHAVLTEHAQTSR